jgi:hypothetical protein
MEYSRDASCILPGGIRVMITLASESLLSVAVSSLFLTDICKNSNDLGTKGATAAQIIPEVVKVASHVTVYQRSPNWILDRKDACISPLFRGLYRYLPVLQARTRASMMEIRERFHLLVTDSDSDMAGEARKATNRKLLEAFPEDPKMRQKLMPDFHPGCKRVILSDDYLPALSQPNCTLETRPIARLTTSGIEVFTNQPCTKGETKEEPFDLIILATGFRAVDHLHPLKIEGTHGRSLSQVWKRGARALYGITIESMPNFAVLYGPNTNLAHNSLILQIESQVRYIAALVTAVLQARNEGKSLSIVPRSNVLETYNDSLQHHLAKTSFADSRCGSWFKDQTGLITTNWHGTAIDYQKLVSTLRWDDYKLSGSGAEDVRQKGEKNLGRVVEEITLSNQTVLTGLLVALFLVFGLLLLKL